MSNADLNIVDLIRDYAPYQGLAFVPLLVACTISRQRRRLVPLVLTCAVLSWVIVLGLVLHHLGGINDAWGLALPHRPRGAFVGTFQGLGIVAFWLLAALLGGLLYPVGRYLVRRRSALARLLPISGVLVYALVFTWGMRNEVLGDTVVASGFTRAGWAQIVPGQSLVEASRILGAPLPDSQTPAFARDQSAQCWISHQYTGFFACIWLSEGTVARKELFYDAD